MKFYNPKILYQTKLVIGAVPATLSNVTLGFGCIMHQLNLKVHQNDPKNVQVTTK